MWIFAISVWFVLGFGGSVFYYRTGLPRKAGLYGDQFKGKENEISWIEVLLTVIAGIIGGPVFLFLALKT